MQAFLRNLPLIVATASAVSCLGSLLSRDADWMRAAVVFSFATVLVVLRLMYWGPLTVPQLTPASEEGRQSDMTAGNNGFVGYLRRIVVTVWPQDGSTSLTYRFFVHLTWIVAAATAVLWLAAVILEEDEWVMAAVGFSFAAFVLVLATAFPGRLTNLQRLAAGVAVVVGVIIVGLMVLSAALSGWPK